MQDQQQMQAALAMQPVKLRETTQLEEKHQAKVLLELLVVQHDQL